MTVLRCIVFSLFALSVASVPAIASDKYSGTPTARVELETGKVASQSGDWGKAAAAYKRATEIDPNFADAHDQYMYARLRVAIGDISKLSSESEAEKADQLERVKKMNEAVTKEYEDLTQQHPDMPIYRWALAQRYNESNPGLQEKYCKEALAMDPAFAPGYSCIAAVAFLRADTETIVQSYRKLIELEPDKREVWRQLQYAVKNSPEQYKEVTDEIVKNFPGTNEAAQALTTYAKSLPESEALPRLEEIVTKYPPRKFPASSKAGDLMFDIYDHTDPAKSAAFAHQMLSELPDDKYWKKMAAYADSMANAQSKVEANEGAPALAILKDVKVPTSIFDKTRLELLTAKAQAVSGNPETAYSDLLKVFAKEPEHALQDALYKYGKILGKSESAVDGEVWNLRSSNATPAIPFTLESFLDGKKVSLSDYKGKVVLLDFWYPNCGPCMGAMPYLQDLYSKYKDSGLVYLGVNGIEGQADFVMPMVKKRGWGFIPLRGDKKFTADVYKVRGYPSTFLIGADGRVYFKPFTYDQHQHDITDLQIQALLDEAKQRAN